MHIIETWTNDDLEEIVALIDAASPVDRFNRTQIQEGVFDDPDLDRDLLRCARVDGRIVGVGAAVKRPPRAPSAVQTGFIKILAVHPSWRGQGIGSSLLADLEGRLAEREVAAIRVFSDAPMYIRPGVDFRLTALVCMLQRRGYAFHRNAVNMDVDLATAPLDTAADARRLAAAGIDLRRLSPADLDAFRAYMAANWGWSWGFESEMTLRREPITTHLAVRRDRIIGFASAAVMGPNHFGPMGVDPEERRHGVGGVLLKRCLADLRDQGFPTADIQWVGPIEFYARQVGAKLSRCFWQMEKGLTP